MAKLEVEQEIGNDALKWAIKNKCKKYTMDDSTQILQYVIDSCEQDVITEYIANNGTFVDGSKDEVVLSGKIVRNKNDIETIRNAMEKHKKSKFIIDGLIGNSTQHINIGIFSVQFAFLYCSINTLIFSDFTNGGLSVWQQVERELAIAAGKLIRGDETFKISEHDYEHVHNNRYGYNTHKRGDMKERMQHYIKYNGQIPSCHKKIRWRLLEAIAGSGKWLKEQEDKSELIELWCRMDLWLLGKKKAAFNKNLEPKFIEEWIQGMILVGMKYYGEPDTYWSTDKNSCYYDENIPLELNESMQKWCKDRYKNKDKLNMLFGTNRAIAAMRHQWVIMQDENKPDDTDGAQGNIVQHICIDKKAEKVIYIVNNDTNIIEQGIVRLKSNRIDIKNARIEIKESAWALRAFKKLQLLRHGASTAKESTKIEWVQETFKDTFTLGKDSLPDANDVKESTKIEWVQKAVDIVRLGKTSGLIGIALGSISTADAKHQDVQVGTEVKHNKNTILSSVATMSMNGMGIFNNHATTSLTMASLVVVLAEEAARQCMKWKSASKKQLSKKMHNLMIKGLFAWNIMLISLLIVILIGLLDATSRGDVVGITTWFLSFLWAPPEKISNKGLWVCCFFENKNKINIAHKKYYRILYVDSSTKEVQEREQSNKVILKGNKERKYELYDWGFKKSEDVPTPINSTDYNPPSRNVTYRLQKNILDEELREVAKQLLENAYTDNTTKKQEICLAAEVFADNYYQVLPFCSIQENTGLNKDLLERANVPTHSLFITRYANNNALNLFKNSGVARMLLSEGKRTDGSVLGLNRLMAVQMMYEAKSIKGDWWEHAEQAVCALIEQVLLKSKSNSNENICSEPTALENPRLAVDTLRDKVSSNNVVHKANSNDASQSKELSSVSVHN